MREHTRIRSPNIRLEAAIELSDLCPVQIQSLNIIISDTSAKVSLLERGAYSTHGWLRSQTRHTVDGNVDNVRSRRRCSKHTRSCNAGGVMRVYVDRKVWILLPDRTDESRGQSVSVKDCSDAAH